MTAKWITSPVTSGKLRVFRVTAEGKYPISGRLDCGPHVTLLLHHAGVDEDLSGLEYTEVQAFPIDLEYDGNRVRIGPVFVPPGSPWPDPKNLWELSASLFMPPSGKWYGYDFQAHLKLERQDHPIEVQIEDRDWPRSFFQALAPKEDGMLLVYICDQEEGGRLKGSRLEFKSSEDVEQWVAAEPSFGELLTTAGS